MNNTYYVRKYYANTDHLKLFFFADYHIES